MPSSQLSPRQIKIRVAGPRGPRGVNYKPGGWSSLVSYKETDVVLYTDGNLWYALAGNTNVIPGSDDSKWKIFLPAAAIGTLPPGTMGYTGAWSALLAYQSGHVVSVGVALYLCISGNLNQTPPNATYWIPFNTGAGAGAEVWRGPYDAAATYNQNDEVSYNNALYIARVSNFSNIVPTDDDYWELKIALNLGGPGPGGSGSWKDPVANAAALPATGNTLGDGRITLNDGHLHTWVGSPTPAWVDQSAGGGGGLQSIVPGPGIAVDNTDPLNPIVSATGGPAPLPPADGQNLFYYQFDSDGIGEDHGDFAGGPYPLSTVNQGGITQAPSVVAPFYDQQLEGATANTDRLEHLTGSLPAAADLATGFTFYANIRVPAADFAAWNDNELKPLYVRTTSDGTGGVGGSGLLMLLMLQRSAGNLGIAFALGAAPFIFAQAIFTPIAPDTDYRVVITLAADGMTLTGTVNGSPMLVIPPVSDARVDLSTTDKHSVAGDVIVNWAVLNPSLILIPAPGVSLDQLLLRQGVDSPATVFDSTFDGFAPGDPGGPVETLVLAPGATAEGNIFTSWSDLYAAYQALPATARVDILFDDTLGAISIPAGSYAFDPVSTRFASRYDWDGPAVTLEDGATFTGVTSIARLGLIGEASTGSHFDLPPGSRLLLDSVTTIGNNSGYIWSHPDLVGDNVMVILKGTTRLGMRSILHDDLSVGSLLIVFLGETFGDEAISEYAMGGSGSAPIYLLPSMQTIAERNQSNMTNPPEFLINTARVGPASARPATTSIIPGFERFNTDTSQKEYWDGSSWVAF